MLGPVRQGAAADVGEGRMKEVFTTVKEGVQALVALSLVGVIAAALVWPDTVGKRFGEAAQGFARSAGGT